MTQLGQNAGFTALGTLAFVLALMAGLELGTFNGEETGMRTSPTGAAGLRRPVPADPARSAAPEPVADRRSAWVQTILARPLLSPGRRPAAPAAGGAGLVAASTLPRVAGILVDGGRRSVIFAGVGGGRPVVVAEGAEVSGFTVRKIETDRVTMVGPNGPRVLRPSFDANRPVASVAPPAAPGSLPGLPTLRIDPAKLGGIPGLPAAAPAGFGAR